jgi:hypothetical protein
MSATRDNHVWVQVRQMANYYVKLGGLKYLMSVGRFTFYTQRVQFYSQNWELEKEFTITIGNLDFGLYDSYWLKDTSYFRPTWEKIAAKQEAERTKKRDERELAEKNARGRQGKKYFPFMSGIKKEENFSEKTLESENKEVINDKENQNKFTTHRHHKKHKKKFKKPYQNFLANWGQK